MTAQDYIQSRLENLRTPLGLKKPNNDDELAAAIYKVVMSKKYRKYAVPPEMADGMLEAIRYDIAHEQPINMTFFHGAYKLWRLEESPEPDWSELFSAIYYTNWLRGICEIYEPGVWFDFFVDDLVIPKLNNIPLSDVETYKKVYRQLFEFLAQYRPANYKMTANGVGEQFESPEAFHAKWEADIKQYTKNFPTGLPEVTPEQSATLELNVKPTPELEKNPNWKAENTLIHDAYISLTKRGTGYHFLPGKLRAFNQPLSVAMGVGTTRSSIAKFWAGVGVLKPTGEDDFNQVILSPKQLEAATYTWQDISVPGLQGKNFSKIRVLEA
jgi:hypothetical protein